MRLTFCTREASAAVTTVFTASVSLMTRDKSCPPRVRWKKSSGSVCRCANSRTRRSRTTVSWIATLETAARYASTFLSTGAPGREQGDREDHLFRRDAAVQERAAIAGLILAQLGGIHEEPVRGGEQQPDPEPHAREAEALQVLNQNRGFRVLALQVLAELVAQVRRGVALGVHRRRGLAVNGAVVGGEQHRHAPPLGLLQRREHRRALEPCAGETTPRRLVPRHIGQDGATRPPVR